MTTKPNRCREHTRTYKKGCEACRAYERWRRQQLVAAKKAGTWDPPVPIDTVADHIGNLMAKGMSQAQIAARAGLEHKTIRLVYNGRHRPRRYVRGNVAQAVLGVRLLPSGSRTGKVDSTGSTRRVRAMALQNPSVRAIATHTGLHWQTIARVMQGTGSGWVMAQVAEAIASAYERRAELLPCANVSATATRSGYLPAHMWTSDNIDDPGYDPLRLIPVSFRIRRRLQAFAAVGHGPDEVAAILACPQVTPAAIAAWARDEKAEMPCYAEHLIVDAYKRFAYTAGMSSQARRDAAERGWAPPAAWDDIDDRAQRPVRGGRKPAANEVEPDRVFAATRGLIPPAAIKVELTQAEKVAAVLWLITNNHTYEQAAEVMGMTESAINKMLQRERDRQKAAKEQELLLAAA